MSSVHFGVTVPQIKRPWVAAADDALHFEAQGFDCIWECDLLYSQQSVS